MSNRETWNRFYQKLNIIFNGVLAVSMIPFALVFLDIQKNNPPSLFEGAPHTALKVSLMFLSLAALGISNWWWKRVLPNLGEANAVEVTLNNYVNQKLIHFVILESSAVIALLGYFLLKEFIFVIIYLGVVFVFSKYRPRFSRVSKDIQKTEDDMVSWIEEE